MAATPISQTSGSGTSAAAIETTTDVNYDHDLTSRVTAIRENGATSGVGVLASYGYDNLGRMVTTAFGNGTFRRYAWDPLSRLEGLQIDLAGTASDMTIGKYGSTGTPVTYNAASQIAAIARSNDSYAWPGHVNVQRPYVTNGLNQYSSVAGSALGYDARGNLTSSAGVGYSYNRLNQLTGALGQTLAYDPLGRLLRYSGGSGNRFYYAGDALLAELSNSNALVRRYVHGPGSDDPIVWYEGSGTGDRRFLQSDERGSVVAVSDVSGAVLGINSYDAFGIPAAGNIGRFQYTGQTWLPEIGLYNYKARMYSPTLGRFMQTDPIGYADGMNWYAYVGNDPVNKVDPSGLNGQCGRTACNPDPLPPPGIVVNGVRNRVPFVDNPLYNAPPLGGAPAAPGEIVVVGKKPQSGQSKACTIDKKKSDAALRRLPYATTGPNTWTDVGWLTEQRRVYTRNRDQWYAVGFAAFTAIGMNADDARKSLRNPSGRIVTGRGHVLAAFGAAVTGAVASGEIARYEVYIDGINDRLEYLRGCTSIR